MHPLPPALAAMLFLAFTAAYLAIRGVFAHRVRRAKAVSRADLRDRLLIVLVGTGQVVLPCTVVTQPLLSFAGRAQPVACTVAGVVAMACGLWLFWRSHADLGESWSVTLELNADHRLVTRGVYRRVRHPMYLSFFVLGVGQALLVANWIAGFAGLASTALLVALRLPKEEAMMIEQFGDEYRGYMRRTGGIVPRWR
ncbi:MAG TPA: protein-S-isoprenylcysteine O-methyltransferase [Burkholderiaceae bacterium]|nr:protein-S-isoprenylcysteine O-methyltransferase [Burkholderiaceae bacterium]